MSEPTISDLIESMIAENNTLKARIEELEKALKRALEEMETGECYVIGEAVDSVSNNYCDALKEAKAVLEEGKK